jgi:DNA repair photolyase
LSSNDFGSVEVEPYIPHIGRKNNVKSIDDVATQGIEEILEAVNLDLSILFRKHEVHEDDIISLLIVPTGAA